jgi:hypothetical protein
MGVYRDIDISLNLKSHAPKRSKSLQVDVNSVRFEANRIIQNYIDRCQVQGWRVEGPTDFLSLYDESRLTYQTPLASRQTRFISARVTFYRDSNELSSGQPFPVNLTVRKGIPLWLVLVIVIAAVILTAVLMQVILHR